MTEISDIGKRGDVGRPPLKKNVDTVQTIIRLTAETRARIKSLVGDNQMAAFIRDAIESELRRREREKPKS
ncbi:hypothetical protein [Bosea vestrisii]|uniref:Ribbon-helix-helix CopG family protein n=1 Tax=Bosea vestrisii TaxID=151416 RepID=A0ABW0H7L9_9HYPH